MREMKKQSEIRKQKLRDHRSLLQIRAKDEQRLNALHREIKEIMNTAGRMSVNPSLNEN